MTNSELSAALQRVLWAAWGDSDEGLATAAADALIAKGMALPEGGAPELARLQLLMNAQPAELAEAQIDALSAAGNRAVNDAVHERLCMCDTWPEKCLSSGGYFAGYWDTSTFDTGMPAVIALWEVMRNDRHTAKVAELRARVAELEAAQGDFLLPWADRMDAKSLDNFVGDIVRAADSPLPGVLDEIQQTVANWRSLVESKVPAAEVTQEGLARLRAELEMPDPIAYGPAGYRCGCGKAAHSNLTPCRDDSDRDAASGGGR